jgi:tetratricopeptide (TPR) repeat protein
MRRDDLDLAESFLDAGEIDDALATLNDFLQPDPLVDHWIGDPIRRLVALRLRAAILARHPDEESLRAALDDLDALDGPLLPDDHLLRSVICERLGDREGALAAVETGCVRHRRHARLAERRLHLLRRAGRLDDAQQVVAGCLALSPADWRWHRWAGELAAEAGDDVAALAHLEAAQDHLAGLAACADAPAFLPMIAGLILARAAALARLDRLDDADALYVQVAELLPGDPLIPFNRGLLAARSGDIDRALELCAPALKAGTPELQAHMRRSLEDSRYAALRARLL